MTGVAINYLHKVIKVLYNKDESIRSFLTQRDDTYCIYYRSNTQSCYPCSKTISVREFEELKELLKSPIEKIDLDQLEKF